MLYSNYWQSRSVRTVSCDLEIHPCRLREPFVGCEDLLPSVLRSSLPAVDCPRIEHTMGNVEEWFSYQKLNSVPRQALPRLVCQSHRRACEGAKKGETDAQSKSIFQPVRYLLPVSVCVCVCQSRPAPRPFPTGSVIPLCSIAAREYLFSYQSTSLHDPFATRRCRCGLHYFNSLPSFLHPLSLFLCFSLSHSLSFSF